MKVGVAGLGLIGGSLLRALGAAPSGPAAVVGFDAAPSPRAAAAADGYAVADSLAGLAGCDLIVAAVPPAACVDVVREALDYAPVVADTASVKSAVVEAVRDPRFVAAHPLAGSEAAGWAGSSADVLRGAPWAVCSGSPGALCVVSAVVDALGGHLVPCRAADHDAAVARTSHVPHIVAQALAGTVTGDPLRSAPALTGGSFRDMTRVAGADPALWGDILLANRDAVLAALDELAAQLAAHRAALEAGEPVRDWRPPALVSPGDWRAARGGWESLLGRRVRRLRLAGDELEFEVAA